jgi:Rps23 Pro-64 3,4-dihydroxylase Tpa1-like proline 4-hydroxylase
MITTTTINELTSGYLKNDPFKFKVIDNFFESELIRPILFDINNLNSHKANNIFIGSQFATDELINNIVSLVKSASTQPKTMLFRGLDTEHNKFAFNEGLGGLLDSIFSYLVCDEFVDYIEKLTGITGLIRNDVNLFGAGIHRIHKGGFLGVHTDFNSYDHEVHGKLDRRINLLIYLNPNWKDEYNGKLSLCDVTNKTVNYKISPILNRCVIFNTTVSSLHGHPEPLNVPDDICRHSIAVYYYTKNKNLNLDFEGYPKRGTVHYDIKDYDTTSTIYI